MELLDLSLTDDHIGVEMDGVYLDLHNNYDFLKCERKDDAALLYWRKNNGDWVPEHGPLSICLKIDEVDSFEQRGITSQTLDELGFIDNADADYNPSHIYRLGDVLIFRFVHGAEILVTGKQLSVAREGV